MAICNALWREILSGCTKYSCTSSPAACNALGCFFQSARTLSRRATPIPALVGHERPDSLLLVRLRYLNCGGIIGYAEDIQYYLARHFLESGRSHEAFKDQRFWTDMFLAQVSADLPIIKLSIRLFVEAAGSR